MPLKSKKSKTIKITNKIRKRTRKLVAQAEPDLVLYISSHASVSNISYNGNFRWFSLYPINGCSIYSSVYNSLRQIEQLKLSYDDEDYRRGNLSSNDILREYCDYVNENIQKRKMIGEYIFYVLSEILPMFRLLEKRMNKIVEKEVNILDKNKEEQFFILFNKCKELFDFKDFIFDFENKEKLLHNLDINSQIEKSKQIEEFFIYLNAVKDNLTEEDFVIELFDDDFYENEDFVDEYLSYFDNIPSNIVDDVYNMKHITKQNNKIKCKFMRLKREKFYSFTENYNGLYIIHNKKPISPKLISSTHTNSLVEIPCPHFKEYYGRKKVSITEIIIKMKSLGFKNIIIYDNSCNTNKTENLEEELSPMADFISSPNSVK